MQKTEKIWLDGSFVPWEDANIHILTHTLHYGMGVFEGIRSYKCSDGKSAVFRLEDHIERLLKSTHICNMKVPFSFDELMNAVTETLKLNKLKEGYIRPLIFIGDGAMGLYAVDNPIRVAIAVWPWGAYLGDEGLQNGIRTKISSFQRPFVNSSMVRGKICGQYVNSILAKREAMSSGYDEAILLDTSGFVVEGSGENIFMVKKGEIYTPSLASSMLEGITRNSVLKIAEDLGLKTKRQKFTRDELYISDEVFMTGTAAEITPIREVDDRKIGTGKPGPITKKIQETFFKAIRGDILQYKEWLTYY